MKIIWWSPFVATVLVACQAVGPAQPVKSPNDDREYRYVVLANNLRAVLIHAPGSDRAAAAASVARGSDHDPAAHPGLAHFVEHMLFIATEKYPEVDGFTDFVHTHGGTYSAYTATDRTTYHFQLKADRLPEALDRFAQFFIAPRFDPDYLEREKESVQSEYQLQSRQDEWRGDSVRKQLLNPAHPQSRFNIGSRDTLRGAGVAAVRSFFEANYSADTITVAVLGPQALDELEALVVERFGPVVDRELGPRPPNAALYLPSRLPGSYAWRTVKSTRTLRFTFPMPALAPHYRTKPAGYLATLIGHEGPGSLHDVLSTRGWIEALSAGAHGADERNATFTIYIVLTEAGVQVIADIVDLTYAWIDLIRDAGIEAWRHRERARRAHLGFRFQEQAAPGAAVVAIAEALTDYPVEDVLRHAYRLDAFDEPAIHEFLGHLTPANALVSISGPDVDGDRVEPVFGTVWRSGPAMLPREVEAPFELPGPNPYLPEDLDLVHEPNAAPKPKRLATGTCVETWHAPDTDFHTPTARVDLQLSAAEAFTPDDVVLATLHAELVEDSMNARAYAAREAGLVHAVSATWTGLRIYVGGYSDNLAVLFEDALDAFVDPSVDAEAFAVARTELAKVYADQRRRRPHEQVVHTIWTLLHPSMWPTDALLDAARRATPQTLSAWRQAHLAGMSATLLVQGNLLADDARALAVAADERFGIIGRPHALPTARRLSGSRRLEHTVDHANAAYGLYLQGSSDGIEERARIGLIGRMLGTRYFTALRTEKQLGYIVQSYALPVARHPGLAFVVQASKAGPDEIEALTRTFLDAQRSWFRGLADAKLEEHKRGYIAALTRLDGNNHERMSRLVVDLANRVLTFDEREQIASAVTRLTTAEVASTFETLIDPARGNRLTVYSPGSAGGAARDGAPLSSIEAFKASVR